MTPPQPLPHTDPLGQAPPLLSFLSALFFPVRCPGCGRDPGLLTPAHGVCPACRLWLRRIPPLSIPGAFRAWPAIPLIIGLPYRSPASALILAFKNHSRVALAGLLGAVLRRAVVTAVTQAASGAAPPGLAPPHPPGSAGRVVPASAESVAGAEVLAPGVPAGSAPSGAVARPIRAAHSVPVAAGTAVDRGAMGAPLDARAAGGAGALVDAGVAGAGGVPVNAGAAGARGIPVNAGAPLDAGAAGARGIPVHSGVPVYAGALVNAGAAGAGGVPVYAGALVDAGVAGAGGVRVHAGAAGAAGAPLPERARALGPDAGLRPASELGAARTARGTPAIVVVPGRRGGYRRRGFHPVRLLLTRARIHPLRLLSWSRQPRDQLGLGPAARARNLHGALRVTRAARIRLGDSPVILVDDVLTTGATLRECLRALHEARIPVLAVVVLARAGDKRSRV